MGTTGTHRPEGQPISEWLKDSFDEQYYEVLDVAIVKRNTAYILMKKKARVKFGFFVPERLFAMVVLLTYAPKSYYNIYYKDMDESMGPYYYECPERILKALDNSPPINRDAWEWRQKCWNTIQRRKSVPKFKVGDIIEFKRSMLFNDGVERGRFTVSRSKPLRFVDDTGYWVRLRQAAIRNPELYTYFPVEKIA